VLLEINCAICTENKNEFFAGIFLLILWWRQMLYSMQKQGVALRRGMLNVSHALPLPYLFPWMISMPSMNSSDKWM
jgi:hypothetical protein